MKKLSVDFVFTLSCI